ncbi:MAG TPA: hypothetical protein VMS89_03925 [Methanoregulaceae archaeon]|nr:hypothetical protein [Methanoregulaceae archaeon]
MAGSWREAVETAKKEGREEVFHDFDRNTYGACRKSEHQGHFSCGRYIEHRCICMPVSLSPEELEQKEKAFLEENPDWLRDDS